MVCRGTKPRFRRLILGALATLWSLRLGLTRLAPARAQSPDQTLTRMRRFVSTNVFGRSTSHDLAAVGTAFRAEIDDPVRRLDDVEIVLDHDDAVSGFDEFVEDLEQFSDVFEMESGCGLVEYVERSTGGALR